MNITLGKNFSLPNDKKYSAQDLSHLRCKCENCKKQEKIAKELFESIKLFR